MRLSSPAAALVAIAGFAASLTVSPAGATPPVTAGYNDILPPLAAELLPTVVNISILKQKPRSDGSMAEGSGEMASVPIREVGSGFIIDPDGYVMTNRHVVEGAYKVSVVLSDETAYQAQVVSTNERPDLALLRIDAGHKLPAVKFGDSDALKMGETVIAIGNPLGLSSSITTGIVSALNRDLNETMIDDFIQTDAAINHGNSGGPLFNIRGEVIGVNTQLISPSDTGGSIGLGLAIPINDAIFVAKQMREYGRLRAGYMGVRLQQLTPEIAEVVGLHSIDGGIVSAVNPTGPAGKAAIHEGDVVLQFGERPTGDIRALLREIGATPPGTTRPVRIWRDGAEKTVSVTVSTWPDPNLDPAGPSVMPPRGERIASPTLGLRAAEITPEIRKSFKLEDNVSGVIVLGVAANSVGADVGFSRGDVILSVGDVKVKTREEIRTLMKRAQQDGRAKVLMLVTSQNRPHWLPVPTAEQ